MSLSLSLCMRKKSVGFYVIVGFVILIALGVLVFLNGGFSSDDVQLQPVTLPNSIGSCTLLGSQSGNGQKAVNLPAQCLSGKCNLLLYITDSTTPVGNYRFVGPPSKEVKYFEYFQANVDDNALWSVIGRGEGINGDGRDKIIVGYKTRRGADVAALKDDSTVEASSSQLTLSGFSGVVVGLYGPC